MVRLLLSVFGACLMAAPIDLARADQIVPGPAAAPSLVPPGAPGASALAGAAELAVLRDQWDRLTVPVMIDGKGPFPFVVDTGASRSVISDELAKQLALPPGQPVILNASSGAQLNPTAVVDTLAVGARQLEHLEAAVVPRGSLGALGMLGVDAVRDQGMVMDFTSRTLAVHPISPDANDPNAILVSALNRYGQLILLDAHVDGEPVFVILDTGAEVTIANSTFQHRFAKTGEAASKDNPALVLSVLGGSTPGNFATVPELTLGQLTVQNLPVVFSDVYTFKLFHLDRRPAMLLGMNALRHFARVSIDYRHREVSFVPNRSAQLAGPFANDVRGHY